LKFTPLSARSPSGRQAIGTACGLQRMPRRRRRQIRHSSIRQVN
jgi:hypothetical protein